MIENTTMTLVCDCCGIFAAVPVVLHDDTVAHWNCYSTACERNGNTERVTYL